MTNIDEDYKVPRNPDGTFIKGFSGCPGGSLRSGQKVVRKFAIEVLPDILKRLKRIYEDDSVSAGLKVDIFFKLIERAAGKVEEAPKDNEDDELEIAKMNGKKIMDALQWAMQYAAKQNVEGTKNE
jgi:hypothetical protein